jgi:hypothetical protein
MATRHRQAKFLIGGTLAIQASEYEESRSRSEVVLVVAWLAANPKKASILQPA